MNIVKSIIVANLLNQRAAVLQRVNAAMALLREAREIAERANVGWPRFRLDGVQYSIDPTNLDDKGADESEAVVRKIVDRGAWQYLMNESGLRTFMDTTAREKWNRSIDKGDYPELTEGNVEATFTMLYDARGDMFERGVIECFRQLSWDYKTNQPFKFGKRIILEYVRSHVSGAPGTSLGYSSYNGKTDKLDDLSRVFSILDGKPEPDHRNGWQRRLSAVTKTTDDDATDGYISVRQFRNGNGHATFLRPDLVEKLNAILAKHYPGAIPFDKHAKEEVAA